MTTHEASVLPADPYRQADVRRVLWVILGLNLAVALAKVVYGIHAGALAIQADGFHSVTDASNNVVGLVAVVLAGRPADEGHPYGHRKFEIVAAGLVGVVLLLMAFDVARGAIDRISGNASPPHITPLAFAVLAVTLAINIGVAWYEARRGRQLDSSFLLADAAHTRSDVFVTLGVLASVAAVSLGYVVFDVVAAVCVAAFIAWAGLSVLRSNIGYLADRALIAPERLRRIVLRVPGVAGAHKIRSRGVPGAVDVDLHIQIAPHLDVVRAHEVTHWVIEAIKSEVRGVVDVVVHTEPADPDAPYPELPWERGSTNAGLPSSGVDRE